MNEMYEDGGMCNTVVVRGDSGRLSHSRGIIQCSIAYEGAADRKQQ